MANNHCKMSEEDRNAKSLAHQSDEAIDELLNQIRQFEFVKFCMADIQGVARAKMVPTRNVNKELLRTGLTFYSGYFSMGPRCSLVDIPQITRENYGNALAIPARGTVHALPWCPADTQSKETATIGEVFCETAWLKTREPQPCARYIARNQLARLESLGYSFYSAFEYEWFLLKNAQSMEPVFDGPDIFNSTLITEFAPFLVNLDRQLLKAGVTIEGLNTEFAAGQFEVTMRPAYGMAAADQAFIYKDAVRSCALRDGKLATFMTKPFQDRSASGCHYNHSLWKIGDGDSALFDGSRADNLSDVARHWVGGLLRHTRALTAFCSPTVNCYRRLHHPWAPTNIYWNIEDRMSSMRVKNTSKKETYIENRLGSAAANPYLIMAATVAAGIDGIVNKIEPPEAGSLELGCMPHTLQETLEALRDDVVLCEALGTEFVDMFLAVKEQTDIKICGKHDIKSNIESEVNVERYELLKYI